MRIHLLRVTLKVKTINEEKHCDCLFLPYRMKHELFCISRHFLHYIFFHKQYRTP